MTTTLKGLHTIELKLLFAIYFFVTATNGVVDVSSQRTFYICVSNFSREAVGLLKHMVLAQTAEPPTVIHAIYAEPGEEIDYGLSSRITQLIPSLNKRLWAEF